MTGSALESRSDGPRRAASLASIAVPRRRGGAPATGKAGDLTQPAAAADALVEPAALRDPVVPAMPAPEPARFDLPPEPMPWSTREPEVFAEPAQETDFAAPAPATAPRCAGEIMAYWNKLRGGRPYPALDEIDRDFVGNGWQDSMIVDFIGNPAMPRIARLGRASEGVGYLPLMTDWILSRGRQAARRGVALDEVQRFEGDGETQSYRLLLLPLGTANGASDCVLCHLSSDSDIDR